jgi:hypothetical protein
MSERARSSVAKNSLIMLSAQVFIKLLGFFLPSTLPGSSASRCSGNTVSVSH